MKKPNKTQATRLIGSEAEKISLHLKLRYVYDESNRWNLYIVVDEMTTSEELHESWSKIDAAREKLKLWQGTDPNWYSVALMLDLEEKKKESSYAELAMDMNFDAIVFLLWAIDKKKGEKFAKAGLITFVNHFHSLGKRKNVFDIQAWEKQGRDQLTKGKLSWKLKEGPITARRITDALRQFEEEKKSNKVVIAQSTSTNHFFNIRITALTNKYWTQARDLVERWDSEGYKSYEERWNARTNELIKKSVEFSGLNSQ